MLFSVRISECGNEWEVQGVRGELAGVVVAQAEAVFMSVTHISKDGEVLTGQIKAMLGTTLNDEMTTKPDVLRGLGIGYQLPKTVGKPLTDHGGGWVRRPKRSEKIILRTNGRAFEEGKPLAVV